MSERDLNGDALFGVCVALFGLRVCSCLDCLFARCSAALASFVCFVFFCFFCLFCVLFSCFLSIASSHDAQQPPHQLAERLARVSQAHREELGGGALRARGVERVRHPRRLQPERREVVRPEGEAAQLAEPLHEHLERRVDLRDWGEIGGRSWREIAEAIGDQIYSFFICLGGWSMRAGDE